MYRSCLERDYLVAARLYRKSPVTTDHNGDIQFVNDDDGSHLYPIVLLTELKEVHVFLTFV